MRLRLLLVAAGIPFALAGIFYLVTRIARFRFVEKLSSHFRFPGRLIAFLLLAGIFAGIGLALGLMDLCVVAAVLLLAWLCSEGSFALLSRCTRKDWNRRLYAPGAVALAVTLLWSCLAWYSDHHVALTEYTVTTAKAVEPLDAVMFSDVHIGTTFDGAGFAQKMETVKALDPDVVLVVGDLIDGSSTLADTQSVLDTLTDLSPRYGTFFVFGNHDKNHFGEDQRREFDTAAFTGMLRESGITVLEDEAVQIPGGYTILGRRDAAEESRDPIADLTAELDGSRFLIDMNHQPNDYAAEEAAGVDLVVSGHTHGGQLLVMKAVSSLLKANDRTYGYEKRGSTSFIVSSGLSDWGIDFKTGCGSEIVLIHIRPE